MPEGVTSRWVKYRKEDFALSKSGKPYLYATLSDGGIKGLVRSKKAVFFPSKEVEEGYIVVPRAVVDRLESDTTWTVRFPAAVEQMANEAYAVIKTEAPFGAKSFTVVGDKSTAARVAKIKNKTVEKDDKHTYIYRKMDESNSQKYNIPVNEGVEKMSIVDEILALDSSISSKPRSAEENYASARPNSDRLISVVDDGVVDTGILSNELINWMSDDEVGRFAKEYEYFPNEPIEEEAVESGTFLGSLAEEFAEEFFPKVIKTNIGDLKPVNWKFSTDNDEVESLTAYILEPRCEIEFWDLDADEWGDTLTAEGHLGEDSDGEFISTCDQIKEIYVDSEFKELIYERYLEAIEEAEEEYGEFINGLEGDDEDAEESLTEKDKKVLSKLPPEKPIKANQSLDEEKGRPTKSATEKRSAKENFEDEHLGVPDDYDETEREIYEAMNRNSITDFQASVSDSISRIGSLGTIQLLLDSELADSFEDELFFIKNTYDLSDTQLVSQAILDAGETLLEDWELERAMETLKNSSEEENEEEFGEYEEPEDWSEVDQVEEETVEEPVEGGELTEEETELDEENI